MGRPKCNRCGNQLTPSKATRDKEKPGYIHKGECPPKKPKPSLGQKVLP